MTNVRRLAIVAVTGMVAAVGWAAIGGASTETASTFLSNAEVGSVDVQCPPGKRVVLGGLRGEFDRDANARVNVDELSRPSKNVLRVGGYGPGSTEAELTAIATCKRKPKSREVSETVGADQPEVSATARCPAGRQIVFGGFRGDLTATAQFVVPTAAFAAPGRRWTVEGFDSSTAGELTALAYCGKVDKAKERSKTQTIAPEVADTVTARCKRKQRFAYGGFDSGVTNEQLTGLERTGRRKWSVTVFNDTPDPIQTTAFAYCVKKK
jgi:hypothetical protein